MKERSFNILFAISILAVVVLMNCTKALEVDNELPIVTILQPENGETITEPIMIQVDVTDNEGISKVEFYIDSLLVKTDTEPEYDAYFNPFFYSDDNMHSIIVQAFDINDNESLLVGIEVVIPEGLENFPELIQPENNEFNLNGTEIQFIWHSFFDASNYNLAISTNFEFTNIIHETSLSDTVYSYIPEETDQLFWKIRAFDQFDNPSNWSIIRSFFNDKMILFSKIYDPSGLSSIKKVLQLNDGSYAILGFCDVSTGERRTAFIKTDKYGNQLSLKTYKNKLWRVEFDMIRSDDNCLILAGGSILENGNYLQNMMLVKIDNFGNVLWEKEYTSDYTNRVNAVIQTMDGGYALIGYLDGDDFNKYVRVIKTDGLGNMQWEYRTYGGTQSGYDIIQTDSGDLILTSKVAWGVYALSDYLRVRKLSIDGEPIWSSSFFNNNNEDINSCYIERSDNGYIIAGRKNYDIYSIEINNNGDLLWNQEYDINYRDEVNSINLTVDGNFILSGWTDIGWGEDERLLLMKIDNNGNMLWNKEHQFNKNRCYGFSAIHCFDGGFIACGQAVTGLNSTKMWLIKTDANGDIETKIINR